MTATTTLTNEPPWLRGRADVATLAGWVAVGCGVALRAAQYAFDRSLWLDESLLALNILSRSFTSLAQPLDFNQAAPLGFLWLQKLSTLALGGGEYGLRLFPFLSGLGAMLLFALVARRLLSPGGAVIAVALFAVSDTLIYYSAEAKQYSSDVLVAVIGLYLATELLRHIDSERPALLPFVGWGMVGAVVVWLSHPAIFMLAAVGGALLFAALWHGQRRNVARLALTGALWALSFAALYLFTLRPLLANQDLQTYWAGGYLSFRPSWLLSTFFGLFDDPAGLSHNGAAAVAFLIGCGALVTTRRTEAALLLLPLALTVAASTLHLYPFSGRLILFLVPALLLVVAAGAHFITELAGQRRAAWAGALFLFGLFIQPLYTASYHLVYPRTKEEIAPVLNYLRVHAEPGDGLYVDWPSQYALQYYAGHYPLTSLTIIAGVKSNDWHDQVDDLNRLHGARVWILFSHLNGEETEQKRDQLWLGLLNKRGKQLDSYTSPGAGVYLYDLSAGP